MATDGNARLELLTSFAQGEVERVREELAKVRRELDDSAPALFRLDREIAELAKKHKALPAERARLDELKKAAGADSVDLEQANRTKAWRERERLLLDAAEREIAWLRGEAGVFAATAQRRLGQVLDPEAERGPNAPLVAEVTRELARIAGELEAAATRTAAQCDQATTLFAKNKRALASATPRRRRLPRAPRQARERRRARLRATELEKTVAELEKARDEHTARLHERSRVVAQRDRLRARLRAVETELGDVLDGAAKKVTDALQKRVQVTVTPEAERSAYRALLDELTYKKRFEKKDLDVVAASFSPEDLFAQVMRGDAFSPRGQAGQQGHGAAPDLGAAREPARLQARDR